MNKFNNLQWGPTEGRFDGEYVYISVPRTFWDKFWQALLTGKSIGEVQRFRRVVIKYDLGKPSIFGTRPVENDSTEADERDHYD
jgi:hypothetical protein